MVLRVPEFDVYRMVKHDASHWVHHVLVAENEEQAITRLSQLKIPARFRIYERSARVEVRTFVVEMFEVERLC